MNGYCLDMKVLSKAFTTLVALIGQGFLLQSCESSQNRAGTSGGLNAFSISRLSQYGTEFHFAYNAGEFRIYGKDLYSDEPPPLTAPKNGSPDVHVVGEKVPPLILHWKTTFTPLQQLRIGEALDSIDVKSLRAKYWDARVGFDSDWVRLGFKRDTAPDVYVDYYGSSVNELNRLIELVDKSVPLLYRYWHRPSLPISK